MVKNYVEWLKVNWWGVCPILGIFLFIFMFAFVKNADPVLFVILLNVPLYLFHESEEYIFPGGFRKFFNLDIFKSGDALMPLETNFIYKINILMIWVLLPVFGLLSIIDYRFGLWICYFEFFAGVAHIILTIKAKKKYNPGLIMSVFVNIPFGIYAVWFMTEQGLIVNPWINVHMIIGFLLNAMLPIMGLRIYKKWRANYGM